MAEATCLRRRDGVKNRTEQCRQRTRLMRSSFLSFESLKQPMKQSHGAFFIRHPSRDKKPQGLMILFLYLFHLMLAEKGSEVAVY